jgi:hypothetical protein
MVKVVEVAPSKRTTCYNCRAVLEYNFSDITEEYVRGWDGGGDTYYRIVCPVCNLKNNVSSWRR